MNLLEDLFTAYYDARKGIRSTSNQLNFEINLEENLIELYREIRNRSYKIKRSICFIIEQPVKREIFAADFRDRIVHHLLYNYLSPFYERLFVEDCYSCRKKKGTLFGIKRLEKHIRSCTKNYSEQAYILTLDLKGYFMSINRHILYGILLKDLARFGRIKTKDGNYFKDSSAFDLVNYLLPVIVFHDPIEGCYMKGSLADWEGLPPSKSLFHSPTDCGLPIGNLTSQLFSNVYLNPFDHFVKQTLQMKFYGRYVDDFYLIHTDRKALLELIPLLGNYLWNEFQITLHPNKIKLQAYQKGVAFLGAVVKPYRRYVHNRTKRKFNQVLSYWNRCLANYPQPTDVPKAVLFKMRSSINSYLGLMQHFRSLKLKEKLLFKKMTIYKYGYFSERLERYILKKEFQLGYVLLANNEQSQG